VKYDHGYFAGKTAIVTGAASGVGLALVEELLECGADKVVLADVNEDHLRQHADRLAAQYPGRVLGIRCDVTTESDVKQMIEQAVDFFGGRLDLLVNNAGAGFMGWFDEMNNDDWTEAFALNFYSAVYAMRAALPIMQAQHSGQIINVISGIAFAPMAQQARYAASKAALNALSIALRTEYWDDGIKISAATPGTTATAIWGDTKPPESAQTPHQSASRILNGAVRNDRIIYGDDRDIISGKNGSNPDSAQLADEFLLNVARERRKGNLGY